MSVTIDEYLNFLAPALWPRCTGKPPAWPPDAFAIAGSLLQRSGAYPRVVHPPWPPEGPGIPPAEKYLDWLKGIGVAWRKGCLTGQIPGEVGTWWQRLVDAKRATVVDVKKNTRLAEALLHIGATADEASWGAGFFTDISKGSGDKFLHRARALLTWDQVSGGPSLCEQVPAARAQVFPKIRTPQRGITLRSLSHNLALCPVDDLEPSWWSAIWRSDEQSGLGSMNLNLLLMPWPHEVTPLHFREGAVSPMREDGDPLQFGSFIYERPSAVQKVIDLVRAAIPKAQEVVGQLHAVVLPELALRDDEYAKVRDFVVGTHGLMLISGVLHSSPESGIAVNEAVFDVPLSKNAYVAIRQRKRHRWCLERSQIVQYGLGSRLDPSWTWWEQIGVDNRELTFVNLEPWLTVCVLICEDLARQDAVAEAVRSIGPNLVIALLMDGPQLKERWSARCATVLADDPGSAVLTLTSIGMAELCRPPYRPEPKRVIALWKDARSAFPVEISLPPGADAVVLCLNGEYIEEFTTEGRSDGASTGQLSLTGNHPLKVP
jgi:hypothetical protein